MSSENTLMINAPLVCDDTLQTNDIARIYPDGSFTILGRKDNVINSGGIKVQAEEIERLLQSSIPVPFVITSVPDRRLGQAVTLLIEGQMEISALGTKLESVLASYYRPKYIYTVTDAAAQRDELQPRAAEQLKTQQDGGDQGVGGTAEDGHQPHCRRKPGGQTQQRADHAAEGSAHKKAGHHLAALEPTGKGQRGEEDLAQKIPRQCLSLLHGSGDDAHARAVIPPHAEEIGKADDQHAARKDPHPRVWEKL